MLTQIDVRHLATIKDLHLELAMGTTVITGETGAGKSVLIDAIELALGNRTSGDMVRPGHEKAEICITFDIRKLPDIQSWLAEADLNTELNECIIRRIIHKDGKSKSYINNSPCTLQALRDLSEMMINIHGQHEHQGLFKQATQRGMLDKFACHMDSVHMVMEFAKQRNQLSETLSTLRQSDHERSSRSEFLKFQLRELEDLNIGPQEYQELEAEHKQLANSGELLQNINLALHNLSEQDEHNIMSMLNHTIDALQTIQSYDNKIVGLVESLNTASIQIKEAESDLRHYLENVDLDPERLQWIEDRIGSLFNMARKHKTTPSELYTLQQRIAAELSSLDNSDERIAELENELVEVEKNYLKVAMALSQSRKKAAKKLEQEITQIVHELSLPHAKFHVAFMPEDAAQFSQHGLEKIVFQITTNLGQPLQPLAKIASGGELSRISLAIHMATAEQHTIPSLIFDEVDVGISGGTAEIVGKLLRRLGKTRQLLCITHLPQVAAQGHHHILVQKLHEKNESFSKVSLLNDKEKIREIARMLGGVEITKKTLDHAKEMLEMT